MKPKGESEPRLLPRRYTKRRPGERAPRTGDSAQSHLERESMVWGTSLVMANSVASVPPGMPPLYRVVVVLAARGAWASVCEATCTMASEGMESTAQDGTMMACVWVAR